jgi:hypothetical protein
MLFFSQPPFSVGLPAAPLSCPRSFLLHLPKNSSTTSHLTNLLFSLSFVAAENARLQFQACSVFMGVGLYTSYEENMC